MLVNRLKGVSSRMIRKKNYPSITKKLWGGALWSLSSQKDAHGHPHYQDPPTLLQVFAYRRKYRV